MKNTVGQINDFVSATATPRSMWRVAAFFPLTLIPP